MGSHCLLRGDGRLLLAGVQFNRSHVFLSKGHRFLRGGADCGFCFHYSHVFTLRATLMISKGTDFFAVATARGLSLFARACLFDRLLALRWLQNLDGSSRFHSFKRNDLTPFTFVLHFCSVSFCPASAFFWQWLSNKHQVAYPSLLSRFHFFSYVRFRFVFNFQRTVKN